MHPRISWLAVATLVIAATLAGTANARTIAGSPDSARAAHHPVIHWQSETTLLSIGFVAGALGDRMRLRPRPVPLAGLDRGEVGLALDRRTIGGDHVPSLAASDRVRDLAVGFPMALGAVSSPPRDLLRAAFTRAVVLYEAEKVTDELVTVMKRGAKRPRPYAYEGEPGRPDDPRYDVTAEHAFQSFPSGHAADAWRGASFAIVDHVLTRPHADWREHAAVGFVGGTLATATASLRVRAGWHFPSDVVAGSAIGIVGGAGVPLLHRWIARDGRSPAPPRRAWIAAAAGAAAGVGAGLLLAPAFASD